MCNSVGAAFLCPKICPTGKVGPKVINRRTLRKYNFADVNRLLGDPFSGSVTTSNAYSTGSKTRQKGKALPEFGQNNCEIAALAHNWPE